MKPRPAVTAEPTPLCEPSLSRSELASPAALEREWLITNGLGGFASGTLAQANTRRYHGLLFASLRPPVDRILMVAKIDATARYRNDTFELATNEYADGTLAPRGFEHLGAFRLDHGLPVWTYLLGDAVLEQRIWMAHSSNTTYMSFQLRHATDTVHLTLLPLCTYRDYHSHTHGGWPLKVQSQERACRIVAFEGAQPYQLSTDRGEFTQSPDWYWTFHHRAEAARGLDAHEDLFRPGTFTLTLAPGETATLIATADTGEPARPIAAADTGDDATPERAAASLERETARRRNLIRNASTAAPAWIHRLTLAADQFIVSRGVATSQPRGTTVIAGYPWFSDWGRDTMIALPGLTLATGRSQDAASILRTFAAHVSQGMLPNRFPDNGDAPEYNTVDATLWYFHATQAYLQWTNDESFLSEIYPVLKDIIAWHQRGTRYGIHVDPSDGLLCAGEPNTTQLTWMDAKIGDWVITPRVGKPVEINALWHYALVHMARWANKQRDSNAASAYAQMAQQVADSFTRSFWYEQGSYLYDVIDAPEVHVDASLRPNQLLAVSLGADLLTPERARAVVDTCSTHLLTPVGLRSLAPQDPRYAATYSGSPRDRDAVYHQGTVWSWLLGPYALAHYRVYRNVDHALALLSGLAAHLDEGCLGTISEIFDGTAPHQPRGCFAQAWSVSETLRAWHTLSDPTRLLWN
jgi:predicted glycogen debranching enzyme